MEMNTENSIWKGIGKPMFRLEDDIKMDLKGIVCENMEWIRLDKDRVQWLGVVNAVMNFPGSMRGSKFCQ
jgi:hypothetical protein